MAAFAITATVMLASAATSIAANPTGITDLGGMSTLSRFGGTLTDGFLPSAVNDNGVISGAVDLGEGTNYETSWPAFWKEGTVSESTPFDKPGHPSESIYCSSGAGPIDDAGTQFGGICVRNIPPEPPVWFSEGKMTFWPSSFKAWGFNSVSPGGIVVADGACRTKPNSASIARPPSYTPEQIPYEGCASSVNDSGHYLLAQEIPLPNNASRTEVSIFNGVGLVVLSEHDGWLGIDAADDALGVAPEGTELLLREADGTVVPIPIKVAGQASSAEMNAAGMVVAQEAGTWKYWQGSAVHPLSELLPTGSGWTITRVLSLSDNYVLGQGMHNGELHDFLLDLGSEPQLSIAPATVTEPTSGTATANFTVTSSASSTSAFSVQYTTQNGSGKSGAIAGRDYEAAHGTLTFSPGETSKTIPVSIKASGLKGKHKFSVTLSEPQGATISTSTAIGTIIGPSPLVVTITVPADVDIQETEAGAVPQNIAATVTIKNRGPNPVENIVVPNPLTIGWHGPAPINALPVKQVEGPSAAGKPVSPNLGTLAPGAKSRAVPYVLQVEGDGHFDIQALVTGSEGGETIHALGLSTINPTSQLLVMKNEIGAEVNSQTSPGLIQAGTHFLVNVHIENRSYLHRLQIDPYEPELSGNAHGGSLVKEGEPTTYSAPTGSLDEVKPSPAIVLAPREARNYYVVVGTSGSNAFAQKGVGGGTRATVAFKHPKVSTVNAADEPTAAPDDRTVLTPGSNEVQVGIDDSAAPQAPLEAWKADYYIAKGVVFGWWDLTWGALKGLPDLGVLLVHKAIENNPGVLVTSLAKGTIDEMYYLTELWGATSADPAARRALVESLERKVEAAFSEAVWMLPEKGAALYDSVNSAVGTYFTKIANNWSAGNWEQALTDMSESGTVAVGSVAPLVYSMGAGVLTRLAPATEALDAKLAAETTKTTEELEALSQTWEPAEDAVKGLEEAADGYEFSVAQLRKFIGMTVKEIEWLKDFVKTRKLSVVLRSRAEESIEWLKKGGFLKPSLIKSKNVSWLDFEFLGYSKSDIGRVVMKKLPPLREIRAQLLGRGIAEGSPQYENVVERWVERKGTYAHEIEEMQQWNRAKQAKGKWPWQDSAVDPTLQLDEEKNYGFRLGHDEFDHNALVPEFQDPVTKRWGPITGDIDLVSVTHADGSSLTASEYVQVLKELAKSPLGIQHPDSTVWVYKDKFWFPKKAAYLESKGNVEFGADGDPRKVTFNAAASATDTWTPFKYRTVWNRGYAVGPGQVP
jgi:Calx-beta domain